MLFLFSNKKNKKGAAANKAPDLIAKNFDGFIKCQQNWSNWLHHKTEKVSARRKLIILILFCVLTCGYNLYLLTVTFSEKNLLNFSVTALKKPEYASNSGNENTKAAAIIVEEQNKRIENFKRYMDSLARSPTGNTIHDSILAIRPGLMDSISLIENMYQSQHKK